MNVSIVSKKIELTEPIKEYINSAITQLEKYNLDIIAVKSIITETRKNKKMAFGIEFTIQVANRDTIVIKQIDKDLYSAIDLAIERAKKVIRRFKEKINNKIHNHTQKDSSSEVPNLYSDVEEDDIIPAELDIDKPMEVEEALEFLKSMYLMFVVFDDIDGKRRVLYRRKDSKFGLY